MSLTKVTYSMIKDGYLNAKDYGAAGDGVADDTTALNAFLTACRTEKKPGFIPAGTYLTSAALDISGVELEGVLGGFENSEGTIIQGDDSHVVLNQAQSNVQNITYSIKNIRIKNGTVGLKMAYAVHCRIENVFITDCVDGVYLGDAALAGPLWCNFKNCRVVVSDTALKINGLAWANANIFDSCFFKGDVAGGTVTAGGLGALANQFLNTEFAGNGRGIVLGLNKSTTFDNAYFESLGPSIVIDGFTLGMTINGCVFASVRNDNADGVPAFIWHKAGTARFSVEGGWIYLSSATVHDNLRLLSSDIPNTCFLTMFDAPIREVFAAGFQLFDTGLPTRDFVISFSDSYTPVWTTTGTAPDIGDGTLSGRYSLNGRICTVQFELVAGSTTTFGTGQFQLSLPFPVANAGQRAQGMARIFESGVGQYVALVEAGANSSTMVFYPTTTNTAPVNANTPMVWSSGDSLRGTITYQIL